MAIHVKTIKQFFVVIIILLIVKLVVTFKSVDEILKGKAFSRTLRAYYFLYAVEGDSKVCVCEFL